jgi:hypothetical protein
MGPLAGRAHTEELAELLAGVESIGNVRELTALLALPAERGADSIAAP